MATGHSDRQHAQNRPRWQAPSGRDTLKLATVAAFLDAAYLAQSKMPRRRYGERQKKADFERRMPVSMPIVNKYLRGGGIPFPLPPVDHLVFAIDAETGNLRWVNDALCAAMHRDRDELIGRNASEVLRAGLPSDPSYREILKQLKANEITHAEVDTEFRCGDELLPISLVVTYGPLYVNWFVDAMVSGAPRPMQSSENRTNGVDFNATYPILLQPKNGKTDQATMYATELRRLLQLKGINPTITVFGESEWKQVKLEVVGDYGDLLRRLRESPPD